MKRRGTYLLAAALALASSACEFVGLERATAIDNPPCVDCVPTGDLELMVEVIPPPGSPFVRAHFLDRKIAAGTTLDITLPRPAAFDYSVVSPDTTPIPARVLIIGQPRIPGREVDVFQMYTPNQPARFSLLPGRYAVRVLPAQDNLPGVGVDWDVRPEAEIGLKEFSLPAKYRRLTGDVSQRIASHVKIEGIRVSAVSIPSGLPSTVAITGTAGTFSIDLPETQDTSFRLFADRPASEQPAWSFEQDVSVPLDADREVFIKLEHTPEDARGEARLRVVGMGPSGPEPVAGAHVALTASTALDIRVFRTSGTTDRDGYAVVRTPSGDLPLRVIAATYQVEITPPSSSPFARTSTAIDLGSAGRGMVEKHVELPLRVRVSGVVASPTGQAVVGAQIQFEAVGAPLLQSAMTGDSGRYEVWLDPGPYVARVDPSAAFAAGESLPVAFQEIAIRGDQSDVALPPITLPSAAELSGVVVGEGDGAIARADVELFVRVNGRTLSLGRTTSDSAGRFSLVVPSP